MMAMTTRSSTSVNPRLFFGTMNCVPFCFFKQDCFVEKKGPAKWQGLIGIRVVDVKLTTATCH